MRHIVEAKSMPSDAYHRQVLAGPGTGIETCEISCLTLPAGYHLTWPATRRDAFYYCLEGEFSIRVGDLHYQAGTDEMVFVPAGTDYQLTNGPSATSTTLEILVPPREDGKEATADETRQTAVVPCVTKMQSEKFGRHLNAAGDGYLDGFGLLELASRDTGSYRVAINAAQVEPDSGGPRLHVHPYDQFYFVLSGSIDIKVGLKSYNAPTNSLVILPQGVVHANWNNTGKTERHLAIMTPWRMPDERGSFPVEIRFAD